MLPVIRLDTQNGFDAYEHQGSLCLWSDYPENEGYYSVSASRARWHKRGGISRSAEKPSYKLTLENLIEFIGSRTAWLDETYLKAE